jgi:hypothetical protein
MYRKLLNHLFYFSALLVFINIIWIEGKNTSNEYHTIKDFQTNYFEVQVKKNETGNWGYQIYGYSKVLISQYQIPAVAGIKYFKDSIDARKVGDLVKQKMLQQNSFPSITIDELNMLKIKL